MAHKFDKKKYDEAKLKRESQKVAAESLKSDTAKKTTVAALADRVLLLEQALGI